MYKNGNGWFICTDATENMVANDYRILSRSGYAQIAFEVYSEQQ